QVDEAGRAGTGGLYSRGAADRPFQPSSRSRRRKTMVNAQNAIATVIHDQLGQTLMAVFTQGKSPFVIRVNENDALLAHRDPPAAAPAAGNGPAARLALVRPRRLDELGLGIGGRAAAVERGGAVRRARATRCGPGAGQGTEHAEARRALRPAAGADHRSD